MTRDPRDTSTEEPDGGDLQVRFRRGPGLGNRPGLLNNPELLTYPFDELSGRVIGWGDATGSRGDRGPRNARPRTGGEWTA